MDINFTFFYLKSASFTKLLFNLQLIAFGITISVIGWLADVYFGRYKVIRCSMWIMWSTFMFATISSVVAQFVESYSHINDFINQVLMVIAMIGVGAYEANIIQFGLDQLHDASTDEITSFIIWFIWTGCMGGYVVEVALGCLPRKYWLVGMLAVCAYLSTGLISLLTCGHLLVKEPVIQNPFKLVYNVVKYAIGNKHPRCRSAFTYCEDDLRIPSRIDFGKNKYGGPFTTEQVEDVKTFFRLVAIIAAFSVAFCIVLGVDLLHSTAIHRMLNNTMDCHIQECYSKQVYVHTFSYSGAILIPVFEFFFYPIFYRCLPSFESQTKFVLGVVFLTATIISNMVLNTVTRYNYLERTNTTTINSKDLSILIDYRWVAIPSFLECMTILSFSIGIFQLIASQVPYSMRGLVVGTAYCITSLSAVITIAVGIPFKKRMSIWDTGVINGEFWYELLLLIIETIAGILLIALMKWYKRRIREDVLPNEHIFAERYYEIDVTI